MVIRAIYTVISIGEWGVVKGKRRITYDGEKDRNLWKDWIKDTRKKPLEVVGIVEGKEI